MKNIAVIGAGTMGNGIAHVFAQSGYNVSLFDIADAALERGMATITKNLDRLVSKERISEEIKASTLANLQMFTDLKSVNQVEQQSSRPQEPIPPSRAASCRKPTCFISIRVLNSLANNLISSLKSTRSSAV